MSLRVDWTALKDPVTGAYPDWLFTPDENNPGQTLINPITNVLGFLLVPLKFGEINPGNVDEFYTRLLIFSKLFGAPLQSADGQDYVPTYEEVRRHIGLKANVVPEGKQAFNNWAIRALRSQAEESIRKQQLATFVAPQEIIPTE